MLRKILFSLGMVLAVLNSLQAQTYFDLSTGDYSQNFNGITTLPTNFSTVAVLSTGTIPVATRTTTASGSSLSVVSSGAAVGIDAATSTRLVFLSTGSTDNSTAIATDLNLNFSSRAAGTLSYSASTIFNSTGNRVGSLRVYYSTNGADWTELSGTNLPYVATNNVAGSGSVSISLPSALNNQATVKLRFYYHNGTGGTTGSRPRIGIDDLSVTSTPLTPTIELNTNTPQISTGNANQSETNHLLSRFSINVATASATLNELSYTAGGNFAAGDISNFKLFTNSTNIFPGGSPLSTVAAGTIANGGTVTFSGLSQACAVGDRYFWIAADISGTAGVGRTVNVPGLDATNFTFASGTPTGTIAAGGAQSFISAVPEIVLSSPSSSSADITQGITNQSIYRFDLAVTVANVTLNGLTINTTGTYAAADLTNLKAWYSTDATFDDGGDVLLSTKTSGLDAGSQVFPSFNSQGITSGTTGYIFITADLPFSATAGNTIVIDAVTTADISFVSGNKSGTANASGTKTIVACTPTNVTSLNLTAGNGQITVSWVNPVCFDELLIVAKPSSSIGASPSGDGSAYTANLAFGTGGATAFDGTGFVVYKGSTSPQTITGLANGTNYFVKVFTRRGSVWSAGVESSATPNLVNATVILWLNTNTPWLTGSNWTGGSVPSGTQVAQFGSANPASSVGINFNGTTNAGTQINGQKIQEVGAIELANSRSTSMSIGNSSGTAGATGQLRLNGVVVNSEENVVLRNNSGQDLTIQNTQGSGNQTMAVLLNDAVENIFRNDGSGNTTISSAITTAAGPVKVNGSGSGNLELQGANTYTANTEVIATTLRLNRTGGATLPSTNNVSVTGGTLRVSTNQELNDLTVGASGTFTIDASTTLTISNDLSLSGNLNNSGTLRLNKAAGNTVPTNTNFNISSGTLRISSNQTLNDLTVASGAAVTIDAGVTLTVNGSLSLSGTLNNAGTLSIGANTVALSGTVNGSGVISANGATLNITGSGALGTLNFDQTTDGTTNSLAVLSINRTSTGTVTLGNKLSVTETVTLTDGVLETAGHLHLKSTSASSTARINGGTNASITGNVHFERFLPWAGTGNNGFRFTTHSLRSAPVINTISGLPVATNTLILFNEANNSYEGISNRAGTWPVAAGYGVWANAANTLTYSGEPQLNTVGPISLPRTNAGWHYLGNPFPSVLDWDAVSRTQVDNAIYVWEKDNTGEGNGVWGSYVNGVTANNSSRYIAPGQGFAVRLQAGSPEITFPAAARTNAANPAYYRQANVQGDLLRVRITKASNQFSLETVIRFRDQATASFDGTYDAQFVSDFSNASPDLYTTDAQGEKYSINSMAPLSTQPVLVPLQLETFGAGNYSFTFNSSGMLSGASIQLEDTKTSTFTQIANGDVINFTAGANDATGRFRLHFNGLATSVASNSLDAVQVYTFDGKLYIRGMEQAEQLRIVDMTGRVVYQNTAVQLSAEGLQPQLAAGTYMVQLVGKEGIKTAKVQF